METLKKTHLFNGLTEKQIDGLNILERTYGRNEIVLYEEDSLESIYILKEGKAIAERIYEGGDSDLVEVFEPGDLIAIDVLFSTFKKMPYEVICDQPSVISIIPLSSISEEVIGSIHENAVHILADKNIREMYRLEALSKHGLRDRIMTFLRIMRQKKGTEIFDISMTQQQLAQYLCVNRSALSFELNNMKRDGLIDYKKSRFEILK